MQLSIATKKRILQLMKQKNIENLNKLSHIAGVALPTLSDFFKGDTKNLRSDTVLHLCEAFGITLAEFYSDSIFDDVISE